MPPTLISFLRHPSIHHQTDTGEDKRQNSRGAKNVRQGKVVDENIARNEHPRDAADGTGRVDQPADGSNPVQLAGDESDHVRRQDSEREAGQEEDQRAPQDWIELSPYW